MICVLIKLAFCLCKNKGADQLCIYWTDEHRLSFRFTDSTITLILKSKISSFLACICDYTGGFVKARSLSIVAHIIGCLVRGFLAQLGWDTFVLKNIKIPFYMGMRCMSK